MIPQYVYDTIHASADALDRSGRDAEAATLRGVVKELAAVDAAIAAATEPAAPAGGEG